VVNQGSGQVEDPEVGLNQFLGHERVRAFPIEAPRSKLRGMRSLLRFRNLVGTICFMCGKMGRYLTPMLCVLALLFSGCATPGPHKTSFVAGRPRQCQVFLQSLDEKVEAAGVRDSSSFPVPGFPYLRSNRFLSALKNMLDNDAKREYWLQQMRKLDLEAREKELRNLPDEVVLTLDSTEEENTARERLFTHLQSCSQTLLDHDKSHADFYQTLFPLVDVPDEYSFLMRLAGLYPLASIPVTLATAKVRKEFRSWFNTNVEDLPIEGRLITLGPVAQLSLDEREIEKTIETSTSNSLEIPTLDEAQASKLAGHFSPIFIQDVAAPYDRFGRVEWRNDRLEIETAEPTVYWYVSHAFLQGKPILQLNYVVWYPERGGNQAPRIERGHLDGLTVRVSLDNRGKPFMVDVMNNCGCYHLFSPASEKVSRAVARRFRLDPFVPQWLPNILPGERFGVRVNSGWHQVQRLLAATSSPEAVPYELVPYDLLEVLPREHGGTESMFDATGIAKGSERIEPFIFFPMGIPSVGSMRQRGNHAISLTGRVHFDDSRLFDDNFVFK
jgi:hypothetical protein